MPNKTGEVVADLSAWSDEFSDEVMAVLTFLEDAKWSHSGSWDRGCMLNYGFKLHLEHLAVPEETAITLISDEQPELILDEEGCIMQGGSVGLDSDTGDHLSVEYCGPLDSQFSNLAHAMVQAATGAQ